MAAEIAACDQLDGLRDGVIGNYRGCKYDGSDLACEKEETDSCLTAGQLESVRLIYADKPGPFQLADGLSAGYPGFGHGGAASGDWVQYIFGEEFENPDSFNFMVADQAAKVVERNPDASALTHDPTKYEAEWQRLSGTLDPTLRDLSDFAANGGKLLIWYPAGDTCVTIHRTAEYYDALIGTMGEVEVEGFSRFYAMPALGHVFTGPAANSVDFLDELDSWVGTGRAPDGHLAVKYQEGSGLVFERPACEFPRFPRYDGEGDPNSAASFYCTAE
jgi:feruloyl esterase